MPSSPAQFLLVRPKMRQVTRPPLGLMYCAAMYPSTYVWDVFADGDVFPFILSARPKVVGVQVLTPQRQEALRILKVAKEVGAVTVAGGPHVAVMLKQMANYDFIDYLVVGDGEYPWAAVCRYVSGENAWQPPRIQKSHVSDLDQLQIPDYSKARPEKYAQQASATLGRGCEGQCIFCSTWWVNGEYRHHGEDWLTELLSGIQKAGFRDLIFDDDCLTAYPESTEIVANAVAKFKWHTVVGTTRVDTFSDEDANKLKKAGFTFLTFGIESGSPTILKKIRKRTTVEMALHARELCRKHGIRFGALMMTGFPFETAQTKQEDAEFRKKLAPDEWGSVGHVMVLPGTVLYQQMKREGRINDDFWLGDGEYLRLDPM